MAAPALTYCNCNFLPATTCLPNSTRNPIYSLFLKPISSSKTQPFCSFPRLRICQRKIVSLSPKHSRGLVDGGSDTYPEAEPAASVSDEGVIIDTKLPRRSLLVQFTCGQCNERTERLINRLAYERGLVYVQCAGCEKYHKLADNLGLVVEYDLREEVSSESNTEQV
ncbi:uncharacterized protein LOC126675186 [Mercurialis annua]|uniref:uncharacterized protein LOC126675186 n=1 Tax=Mercurialis annua TaxID=3986 RepID=UPI00215EF8DF|nr:uncharacterized protein LOC126675186 [Mercurialis annua]